MAIAERETIEIDPRHLEVPNSSDRPIIVYKKRNITRGEFAIRSLLFVTTLSVGVGIASYLGVRFGLGDTNDQIATANEEVVRAREDLGNLRGDSRRLVDALENDNFQEIGEYAARLNDTLDDQSNKVNCETFDSWQELQTPTAIDGWC